MKQAYVKGTDTQIIGTLERLTARANISGFDEKNEPIWEGSTKVFWDSQKTQTCSTTGQLLYLDEDGNEYRMDELEFRDDGEA
jgi:hypothetical protein